MVQPLQRKSSDRLAFEHYLRTGERLSSADWERKFNPNHDERGRFAFGAASAGMGPRPTGTRQVSSRRPGPTTSRAAPEIPGYPETGRTAWRASNDEAFAAAADYYNRKYGLKPRDAGYKTPAFLKAWAMVESGGEGDEHAFRTDPFQVNKVGDWDPKKQSLMRLRPSQRMTPAVSAFAALEWLRLKSQVHDTRGHVIRILSDVDALIRYNGKESHTRQSGRLPHKIWYATTIDRLAKQAGGERR